jgi:hypothetical protein
MVVRRRRRQSIRIVDNVAMSALGHKRPFRGAIAMPALPPKADVCGATGPSGMSRGKLCHRPIGCVSSDAIVNRNRHIHRSRSVRSEQAVGPNISSNTTAQTFSRCRSGRISNGMEIPPRYPATTVVLVVVLVLELQTD